MFGGRYFGARHFGSRYFGKHGLVLDGAYFGQRHYGSRYFGKRYFGNNAYTEAFPITQTAGVGLSGALQTASGGLTFGADFAFTQVTGLSLTGTMAASSSGFSFDGEVFYFTPPLSVQVLAGTLQLTADVQITAPAPGFGGYYGRRYFGGRQFGARYFGSPVSWSLTQTAGLGLTGTLTTAGGISTTLAIAQTNTLGLTGTMTLAGAVDFDATADLTDFHPVGSRKRRRDAVQRQKTRDRASGVHRHDSYYAWVQSTLMQLAAAGVLDA